MYIPIWVLVVSFFGLPIAGFLLCAVLTAGSMEDDKGYDDGFADGVRYNQFGGEQG